MFDIMPRLQSRRPKNRISISGRDKIHFVFYSVQNGFYPMGTGSSFLEVNVTGA
jgi:hypothetical protein